MAPPRKSLQEKQANRKAWYQKNKKAILARRHERAEELSLYNKKYYEKNKETINARHRLWLLENSDHVKEYVTIYKGEHQEQLNAKQREYYSLNSETVRAKARIRYYDKQEQILLHAKEYCEQNRETINQRQQIRRQNNTEKTKLETHIRAARKRGLPATLIPTEHRFMLEYWGYACAVCGNQQGFLWTLADDHWIPITATACPGTVATNMIPLCHGRGGCNNSKGNSNPHAWLVRRFGSRKAAKIEAAIAAYFAIVKDRFPVPEKAQL